MSIACAKRAQHGYTLLQYDKGNVTIVILSFSHSTRLVKLKLNRTLDISEDFIIMFYIYIFLYSVSHGSSVGK